MTDHKYWPARDDEKLRELFTMGLSDARIGQRLRRTEGAVKNRRQRLKLLRAPFHKNHTPKEQQPRALEPWPADMPHFTDHPHAHIRRQKGLGDYGLLGNPRRPFPLW